MASRRNLEQRVHARLARIGGSAVAVPRHVANPPESCHLPGIHPETTTLRILLACAGLRLSEEMVLGLGGGIGAGMLTFRYEREGLSTLYLGARHRWDDGIGFIEEACARLGVRIQRLETGGTRAAAWLLHELLGRGPVIALADPAELGHHGWPAEWGGGGHHVVVYEANARTALLGDLGPEPVRVPAEVLARARGKIRKDRHRLVTLEAAPATIDLEPAIQAALRACADGLLTGRRNFTVDALAAWGDRRWTRTFPPGHLLGSGLRWTYYWIERAFTGGGLMRPMYARFLTEVGLGELAGRYADLGRRWTAFAEAALPAEVPALAAMRGVPAEPGGDFPLTAAESADLVASLRVRIGDLVDAERQAARMLRDAANLAGHDP